MQEASRSAVEAAIRQAFADVRLGNGVSLRQAAVIDDYGRGVSDAAFIALPAQEVTDDWAAIPPDELDSQNIAHLDAEGLRYYLPALVLRLLEEYGDGGEMWTIGTIFALDQRDRSPHGFLELLSPQQRTAIAQLVRALPQLVALDYEDAHRVDRALRDVWSRYLPRGADDRQNAP